MLKSSDCDCPLTSAQASCAQTKLVLKQSLSTEHMCAHAPLGIRGLHPFSSLTPYQNQGLYHDRRDSGCMPACCHPTPSVLWGPHPTPSPPPPPPPPPNITRALCCRSGLHRPPSLPTKHALYLFLQGLLIDSPDLVPAASVPAATPSSTHFRNGPLQTGAQLDADRYNML